MNKTSRTRLFSLVIGAVCILLTIIQAHAFVLTENGHARFEIILPQAATAPEQFAAKELLEAVGLATGAEPSIREAGADIRKTPRIILGTPENQPEIAKLGLKASPAEDEIIIQTAEDVVYLGGSNPRSVLYSTYRFLEEVYGFRWLWPGETGIFFNKKASSSVNDLSIREKAGLRYRSLSINSPHYEPETLLWMARNRMNVYNAPWNIKPKGIENLHEKGFIIRFAGHNLHLPNEVLEANPEYAAEYGGVRGLNSRRPSHLCWSNSGVQKALVEHIGGLMQKIEGIDIWSIYPVDATNFCQCKECLAMAPDITTRYQKLCTILIEELTKRKPGAQFDMLAYQSYRSVPELLAPFDQVYYTSYNISYRHPLNSGAPSNRRAIEEIREWQNLGAKVGLRNYDMIPFNQKLFVPLVSYEVAQSAYSRENGLVYYSTEVTPYGYPVKAPQEEQNWVTNRMNLYALAAALWNPQATAQSIVSDWMRTIYGEKAALPMARYYNAMEKAWMEAPGEVSYFGVPPAAHALEIISDSLISEARAAFAEARSILGKENASESRQRALDQVTLEEKMFTAWEQIYLSGREDAHQRIGSAVRTDADLHEITNPDAPCWNSVAVFPPFRTAAQTDAGDATEVQALWKDATLYLRLRCHDSAPGSRLANFRKRDDDVHQDDSVEIFINKPASSGYYHLAFNSLGTQYDAYSEGGMNLDKSVNPDWKVFVREGEGGWDVVVALPLAEFGYQAEEKQVFLSIKRTRPRTLGEAYPKSGWPDAAYHSPVNAGTILLLEHPTGQVLIYGSGREDFRQATLVSSFSRKGWKVSLLKEQDGELPTPASEDFFFLRHNASQGSKPLSDAYLSSVVYPWLNSGGRMLIACSHGLRFDRWFPGEDLAVKWAGWAAPARRSEWFDGGVWAYKPNDLSRVLKGRTTPASAYRPLSERWQVLATQPMRDGESAAFLMHTRVGEGYLFLTSSNMGYGGGFEMFGDLHPDNAVKLIQNLHYFTNP